MRRRPHRPVGKILALSFLMSCSVKALPSLARPISPEKQTYSVIKSDELRQMLDNVILSWADDDGSDPYKFKEIFYRNGEYGRLIRQPRLGKWIGTFEIKKDYYCVVFIDETECSRLLRSSRNELFRQPVDNRYTFKMIKVKIKKIERLLTSS